jgi:hypothetical protein
LAALGHIKETLIYSLEGAALPLCQGDGTKPHPEGTIASPGEARLAPAFGQARRAGFPPVSLTD